MSAMWRESESVSKSAEDLNNPIKKRINTELFINGKYELYIHKRQIKNSWSDLLDRDTNSWLERQKMWE